MSEQANAELEKLVELLSIEKKEDLAQYKRKMQGTSFKERREMGVLWYPVRKVESKYDAGERLIVKLERTPEHNQNHSFQSGKLINLFFSSGSTADEEGIQGVVNQVRNDSIVITLNCDELPSWIERNGVGVQLLFDEHSYREMEWTLKSLISSENPRIVELKNKILGFKRCAFAEQNELVLPQLNGSQNSALNKVLSCADIAVVHGPPGTGKTTTIVESILETLKSENQVLVCTPSNAAVDLLVEKLAERGVGIVRVGHPARVTEEILNQTLDAKISRHNDYKLLKDLKKRSEEYFAMSGKWKRSFGATEREQRKLVIQEARKLRKEAQILSGFITEDILMKSQVVATTLVGANHSKLKGMRFTTAFIDEAGQALEPASWIPVLKSERIIFAGDHQQLPPTVKSHEASKKGLINTLFEKVIKRCDSEVMLKEQYRMHKDIMRFSSEYFYNGCLEANEEVANQSHFVGDAPVEFIDTAGTGYFESINRETKSSFNKEEAVVLVKHLLRYELQLKSEGVLEEVTNVAVISPYKAQVECLKEVINDSEIGEELKSKVSVNTIDSFQGQERDIVYISLVRSNEEGNIGFLADERRMNVAMTRAKMKLVIVGDSGTISVKSNFYKKWLDYIEGIDAYSSAFELMYD